MHTKVVPPIPLKNRPISVSFLIRTSWKETEVATPLRLEKICENRFFIDSPPLDPKSITTHMPRIPQNFSEFFFRSLSRHWRALFHEWKGSKADGAEKSTCKCISLDPAFIFLAINQTHLRLAFGCSTKLFSYPTGAIFWIIWIVIRHCQVDDGGGVGRSQGERRRQAVELWRTGGEEKEWRPLLYSSAFYEPSIT